MARLSLLKNAAVPESQKAVQEELASVKELAKELQAQLGTTNDRQVALEDLLHRGCGLIQELQANSAALAGRHGANLVSIPLRAVPGLVRL